MARSNPISLLSVLALIAVIVAAVYFIYQQSSEDDELEIEIGLVADTQSGTMAASDIRPTP